MKKLTKNRKKVQKKIIKNNNYTLEEASKLIKDINFTKFDSSINLTVNLGVDPRKPNQMIRGISILPNGTGKIKRILALVTPDKESSVKEVGADYIGLDEYLKKIKDGWLEFDIIVTMPMIMIKLGPLGKILGPRGLMPNPKSGTVTMDPALSIKEIKSGKIDFKVDKYGIIHTIIGKSSFSSEQIKENISIIISSIQKLKPSTAKGTYIKSIYLSSTMSPSILIDTKNI